MFIGIAYGSRKGSIFHTLAWLSRKQRGVSTSSNQAKRIAAVTSVGYALHVQQVLQDVAGKNLPVALVVHSLGLHKTLAKQATPKDMSSIYDVQQLKLDFESEATGYPEDLLSKGRLPVEVNNFRNYGKAKIEKP